MAKIIDIEPYLKTSSPASPQGGTAKVIRPYRFIRYQIPHTPKLFSLPPGMIHPPSWYMGTWTPPAPYGNEP